MEPHPERSGVIGVPLNIAALKTASTSLTGPARGNIAFRQCADHSRALGVLPSSQHSIEAGSETVVSRFWSCIDTKPKTCSLFD